MTTECHCFTSKALDLEFQSCCFFKFFPAPHNQYSADEPWLCLAASDSPGPKSLLLEEWSLDLTGQQHWPCSSDHLWDVPQQCQNSASTTKPQFRIQERKYFSTTFKALTFGNNIKTKDFTFSLSNGSKTISVPEQWALFLTIISAVWQRKCIMEITDSKHL